MPEIVIPYCPRPLQARLHGVSARFKVLVLHRRWGKTVWSINELIRASVLNKEKRPRYAYISPTLLQSKDIAWDYLKEYTQPIPKMSYNETELRADFPWGARIRLYGADNPHRIRGLYLDGAVLDEYPQMSPIMWSQIIRPALADRKGFAIFAGTPMGQNHFFELFELAEKRPGWYRAFYPASETGVIQPEELQAAREEMEEEEFLQEFECSWSAAVKGAFYSKAMAQAEAEGRITEVPYDVGYPVHTCWDIGYRDATVIWFYQNIGPKTQFIDVFSASGLELSDYVRMLQSKPYVYGHHVAPPDMESHNFATGVSGQDVARQLGIYFTIAEKMSVMQGIDATRRWIKKCWFDREKCRDGILALQQYRTKYNAQTKQYSLSPLHDWTSNFCDALRYGAITPLYSEGFIPWDAPMNDGFYAT